MIKVGATRFEFERAIRTLPIRPPVRKLVALMVATYANADGTNAHPGEGRLADECGITTRAVRGHLNALRNYGLLERTYKGTHGGRRALADEYRLAIPGDVQPQIEKFQAMEAQRAAEAKLRKARSGVGADHRNEPSGAPGANSGTYKPDHRNVDAEHRNEPSEPTGTCIPPTITGTKEVDQSSPTFQHPSASSSDRCRCGHDRFAADGECLNCHEMWAA